MASRPIADLILHRHRMPLRLGGAVGEISHDSDAFDDLDQDIIDVFGLNFEQRLWAFGFEPLSVAPRHADGIRSLPELVRHDPFDRVLLSEAKLEGCTY